MGTKWADMNEEERKDAYNKWVGGKDDRSANASAKRKAIGALVKKYKTEYLALLKAAGGKAPKDTA